MTIFSSGMLKVAEFYWLKPNHEALLHVLENNKFEMKIVDLNKNEIHYHIDIHNSDPGDTKIVYEDDEHSEEDNVQVFYYLEKKLSSHQTKYLLLISFKSLIIFKLDKI